ncbi:hypothetical protein Bca4012_020289 [Brassica carinata]
MSNQPPFSMFPIPYVGGRARPRYPSARLMSPVNLPEANNEAIPGAPSRRRRFHLSDEENADGPRLTIGEGDLAGVRRRYSIPESVKLRCAGEFERAPDGGVDEVAIFEAYFEAGFYQIWSRDGEPIVNEPPRGVRGGFPHDDLWNRRYMFIKVNGAIGYPLFWRSIDVARPVSFAGEDLLKLAMEIPKRFRWISFLVNQATLSHSRVWGEIFYPYLAIVDLDFDTFRRFYFQAGLLGLRYCRYMVSTIRSNRGGEDNILRVRREQVFLSTCLLLPPGRLSKNVLIVTGCLIPTSAYRLMKKYFSFASSSGTWRLIRLG